MSATVFLSFQLKLSNSGILLATLLPFRVIAMTTKSPIVISIKYTIQFTHTTFILRDMKSISSRNWITLLKMYLSIVFNLIVFEFFFVCFICHSRMCGLNFNCISERIYLFTKVCEHIKLSHDWMIWLSLI